MRAYVDANRAGADWLTDFAESAGVPFTRSTAYSYAQGSEGVETVDAEVSAGREAGLAGAPRLGRRGCRFPFPVAAAAGAR